MGNFANSLQLLRQRGLQGNMSPYYPTPDLQPTDNSQASPYSPQAPDIQAPQQAPPQLPMQQLDLNQPTSDVRNEVGGELASAYAPPRVGKARQILGAIMGAKNPGLGEVVTGDAQRQRQIQGLTGEYGSLQNTIQAQQGQRTADLDAQNVGSEIQARNAQSNLTAVTTPDGKTIYLPEKDAEKYLQNSATVSGRQAVAATNKRFIPVSGVGVVDTQGAGGIPSVIPGTSQGITITPEIAQEYQMPDSFVGKPMKLSDLASFQRGQDFQNTVVEGAQGPASYNKRTGVTQNLGLGNPNMGHAVQVADPNNPGNTMYTTAGNAIAQGNAGTASAELQVPRQALKAGVPTNIGNQNVAFNTMIQHAQLLRQATQALNNGNVQALNGLKNSFKNQFGYAGPITAQAIADAYNGEVTSVLNKGHITDKDLAKSAQTLDPSKQSPEQMDSVLGAYQNLAQSKMNMLHNQASAAVNASQPNARQQPQIPEGAIATSKQDGHKIKFTNGAWVDAVTGQPFQ